MFLPSWLYSSGSSRVGWPVLHRGAKGDKRGTGRDRRGTGGEGTGSGEEQLQVAGMRQASGRRA